MLRFFSENFINNIVEQIVARVKNSDEYIIVKEKSRQAKYKAYIKSLEPYEDDIIKRMRKLFNEQEKEVLNNLSKSGLSKEDREDKSEKGKINKADKEVNAILFNKKKWQKRFSKDGEEIYQGMIIDYGQRTIDDLNIAGLSFNVKHPLVVEFIKDNGVYFGRETQDTAYEALKSTVAEGINAGEGIPKLSKRVGSVYEGYTSVDKPWKAKRIAQTETIKASNFGKLQGDKQSGVVIGKEWLATDDSRTRDTHMMADGQKRKIDDTFDIGGSSLMYPGDPSGDPGESINCRCTMLSILEGEKI